MKKATILLSAVLSVPLMAVHSSFAAQRKHRPWMLFGSAHHSSATPETQAGAEMPPLPEPPETTQAEAPATASGNKIVSQALRYKGTHYKFGGTTKRGMDCSGLVARVWSDLKMKKVPRMSSALYHSGQPVTLAELRPGDLVFFKNTYKSGISHVGVYTGRNKFVHASNHRKGVTITPLSDPYYQIHYAGARRLY